MAKLSVSVMPALLAGSIRCQSSGFLGVVRAGRIAGRRADAAVFLLDQLLVVELLVGGIAPEFLAHALVQALGEGLGEPVGQRLEQDRV